LLGERQSIVSQAFGVQQLFAPRYPSGRDRLVDFAFYEAECRSFFCQLRFNRANVGRPVGSQTSRFAFLFDSLQQVKLTIADLT